MDLVFQFKGNGSGFSIQGNGSGLVFQGLGFSLPERRSVGRGFFWITGLGFS